MHTVRFEQFDRGPFGLIFGGDFPVFRLCIFGPLLVLSCV
jgi:hypothetical protein